VLGPDQFRPEPLAWTGERLCRVEPAFIRRVQTEDVVRVALPDTADLRRLEAALEESRTDDRKERRRIRREEQVLAEAAALSVLRPEPDPERILPQAL
jgi:hypothetical protein